MISRPVGEVNGAYYPNLSDASAGADEAHDWSIP